MRVAILPGDGIGPEIIAQAKKVLRKLSLGLETPASAAELYIEQGAVYVVRDGRLEKYS